MISDGIFHIRFFIQGTVVGKSHNSCVSAIKEHRIERIQVSGHIYIYETE